MSNGSRHSFAGAPFYDLFKLLVAILLLLLFLFLWIGLRPASTRQPDSLPVTFTSQPSLPTLASASSTSPSPLTETPTPTLTAPPAPTETPAPTITPTLIPSPTEAPVTETIPTPIVEIPAETNVCEAYSRSQLQVGMQVTIIRRLNFRSSPGILNNWLMTNIPGTQVEVVGGPECTRYLNGGAYLWWQVKLPDGRVGWSAEASAFGAFYFMEPVK